MLRWARRRQGMDALPTTLGGRRIYILPTRTGMAFAALLLAMTLAGLNYNNSLALLLTFTLGGFATVALLQCHRRLVGLRIEAASLQPGFAGGSVVATLTVRDASGGVPSELNAALATAPRTPVPAQGQEGLLTLRMDCAVSQRGRWTLPTVRLWTEAPFRLSRAWVYLHLDVATVVYPKPAGDPRVPMASGGDGAREHSVAGQDEWATLRPLRAGDSPRQVAWKAYARGAPLLVKEYRDRTGLAHVFDFESLHALSVEQRLSQLARWIVETERNGDAYGLRLGNQRFAVDRGPQHAHRCLTALGLFAPGAASP